MVQKTALILLLAAWLLAACSPREPDIDVVTDYDMGAIVKGELAVADVPVRNLGAGPLTVLGLSTSCGCTKATLSSTTIPQGGHATLHVVYDSNAHEADIGVIERYVFISSDDPDEADVQITITVMVRPRTSRSGSGANGRVASSRSRATRPLTTPAHDLKRRAWSRAASASARRLTSIGMRAAMPTSAVMDSSQ